MLNHITIMGRLCANPETRYTASNVPVTSFSIACDRDFSGKDGDRLTDFFDCVAWRGCGEFIGRNFKRGSMIALSGRLQTREWQDKDGNKRKSTEVLVENAYFGDSKRKGDSERKDDGERGEYRGVDVSGADFEQPDFSDLEDADGELPF